jgi:hypothetical protein
LDTISEIVFRNIESYLLGITLAVLLLLDEEMETEIAPIWWSESSDIRIMHPLETGTYLMMKFLPLWDLRVLSTTPCSAIIKCLLPSFTTVDQT